MSDCLIGVDLGGTSIKAAIADREGRLLRQESIPTESHLGPAGVLDRIAELADKLSRQTTSRRVSESTGAIGIGVPGLIDVESGVTRFLPNLPTQWRDVPVAETLGQRLGCPVRLLNDARTATLGELVFGYGKDDPAISFAFFSLGTGVGGGLVIDGQLRLGPLGAAGELGHQTIIPDGPLCGCGNRGCLETLASGPAITAAGVRLMHSGLAPALHAQVGGDAGKVTPQVMASVADRDQSIAEVLRQAAIFVGIAAANVVTILHPQLIVLGGGVADLGSRLTNTVAEVIDQRVGMFPTGGVQVVQSKLGAQAGLLGAIALAGR